MTAHRRPVQVGDIVVVYAPPVVVERVDDGTVEVAADGLIAAVPTEWLVVVHDRRGGDAR